MPLPRLLSNSSWWIRLITPTFWTLFRCFEFQLAKVRIRSLIIFWRICEIFKEWATEEGSLHRMLASKILSAHGRTTSARSPLNSKHDHSFPNSVHSRFKKSRTPFSAIQEKRLQHVKVEDVGFDDISGPGPGDESTKIIGNFIFPQIPLARISWSSTMPAQTQGAWRSEENAFDPPASLEDAGVTVPK